MILKEDVLNIQKTWSDGLLKIVRKYHNNLDYIVEANEFIDNLYAYDSGVVLFKPTLACDIQFRLTKEDAMSYFIAHNNKCPEDSGFALKEWKEVIWENSAIKIEGDLAIAMGNYYFIDKDQKLKVEYSFVYKRNENGALKIILHDSHLPYYK
tara:strand:- start:1090 stop:1548 length:459 start_codon:yes stop_codon:yes gene_type:complete